MRLILIRHAESEHTLQQIIAGPAGCRGLSQQGRQQARRLAERLQASGELAGCQALLCSPVLRAVQTAELLVPALRVRAMEQDASLCELLPGAADGMSWAQYRASFGAFDLLSAPERPFAPGGESWSQFLGRVGTTLERLAARFGGQTVVAVTHAGFIVAAALVLFAIPRPGTGTQLDPAHTALTEWSFVRGTWRLVRYNDACHLQTSASAAPAGQDHDH